MAETITIFLNTTASTNGIRAVAGGLDQVKTGAERLNGWLKRTAVSLAAVGAGAVGIAGLTNAMRNAVTTGVRFNSTIEDARLGIAAILKQFNPQQFANFSDALKVSGAAIELIKKKAIESPASFTELVRGFQAISGAATGAGIALRDQVDLVVLMSQALGGLGIRPEQLLQESRALITGNINEDALAARILGITRAQIEDAKRQGQLYQFLTEKLKAFGEAGKIAATTLTGSMSNLGDIVQQKLGELTVPIFEALRQGALRLTDTISRAELVEAFQKIANRLGTIVSLTFDLATFGVRNVRLFTDAVEALAVVIGLLATRTAIAFAPALFSKTGGMLAWFAAVNTTVASVSKYAGPIAGIVAAFSTLTGTLATFGAAFAGWEIGKIIGRLEVMGATINEVVRYNILRAMEAWEEFKISMGRGNPAMLEGVRQSMRDLLVPPQRASGLANIDGASPPMPGTRMNDIQAQRLELEKNSLRIAELKAMTGISEVNRERALKTILKERVDLLEYAAVLEEQSVADEQKIVGGEESAEYAEAIARANRHLEEMLRLKNELFFLSQDDFFSRFSEGIRLITEEFDNLEMAIADVLVNGIRHSIDTVADGIWQVIDGTATWGELFQNVARGIVSDLIRIAIQEVLVDTIKRGIMSAWQATVDAFRAKDVASANAAEAAKTPALAANATLSSISSYGLAVAIGVAAIAAILASVGAFQEGGVVAGGEQLIRVNERGQEAVLNARATQLLGSETINALNAGSTMAISEQAAGQLGGDAGNPVNVTVIVVDNQQALLDAIESSAGQTKIVQVVRNNKTEIGIA